MKTFYFNNGLKLYQKLRETDLQKTETVTHRKDGALGNGKTQSFGT